jgi:hypothetical protein
MFCEPLERRLGHRIRAFTLLHEFAGMGGLLRGEKGVATQPVEIPDDERIAFRQYLEALG